MSTAPFMGLLVVRLQTPSHGMSRNYYSEINLHLIWHTLQSRPLLSERIEPLVHRAIKARIVNLPGAFVHEIGGTATHVHVVVTIAPTIVISEFVGQLKGGSAHDVNRSLGQKSVEWQTGYGVVTFGTRDLEWVKDYARNQKEHHARGDVHERLERFVAEEVVKTDRREAP